MNNTPAAAPVPTYRPWESQWSPANRAARAAAHADRIARRTDRRALRDELAQRAAERARENYERYLATPEVQHVRAAAQERWAGLDLDAIRAAEAACLARMRRPV